jgi:hypothetical protein
MNILDPSLPRHAHFAFASRNAHRRAAEGHRCTRWSERQGLASGEGR